MSCGELYVENVDALEVGRLSKASMVVSLAQNVTKQVKLHRFYSSKLRASCRQRSVKVTGRNSV